MSTASENRGVRRLLRDIVRDMKHEATAAKSELIRLQFRLEQISPREARSLGAAIAKLEAWQNKETSHGN